MRNRFQSITILILFIFSGSKAQGIKQITINLSPIVVDNGRYYYDGRRVKFEGVIIPLIAVHDVKIDQNLKSINIIQDLRVVATTTPLVFALYNLSNQQRAVNNFNRNRNLLWGSVGFVTLFNISISIVKRKTINRYNEIILQPTSHLYLWIHS